MRWSGWLVALLPLALIFDLSGLTPAWRSPVLTITAPFLQSATQLRWQLNQVLTRATLLSQATKQVILLQNELTQAKSAQAQLQSLQEENQALRRQLDLPPATRPKLVATTIISYPDSLVQLPDDGSDFAGSAVLSQGVLLGFIKDSQSGLGRVELLVSPTSRRLLAKTAGGVQGLVNADGKNLTLSAVDRQAQIESGELVLTTGQPGVPANLIIGSIGRVVSPQTAPTQTFAINQPTTFYQEKVVEVRRL